MKMMRLLILASLASFSVMVSDVNARVLPLQSRSADPEAIDPSLVSRFDFVGADSGHWEIIVADNLATVAVVGTEDLPASPAVDDSAPANVSEPGTPAVSGPPSSPLKNSAAPREAGTSVVRRHEDRGVTAAREVVGPSSAEDSPKKAVLFTLPSAEECRILIFALVGGGVAGLFFRGRLLQERQASLALMD